MKKLIAFFLALIMVVMIVPPNQAYAHNKMFDDAGGSGGGGLLMTGLLTIMTATNAASNDVYIEVDNDLNKKTWEQLLQVAKITSPGLLLTLGTGMIRKDIVGRTLEQDIAEDTVSLDPSNYVAPLGITYKFTDMMWNTYSGVLAKAIGVANLEVGEPLLMSHEQFIEYTIRNDTSIPKDLADTFISYAKTRPHYLVYQQNEFSYKTHALLMKDNNLHDQEIIMKTLVREGYVYPVLRIQSKGYSSSNVNAILLEGLPGLSSTWRSNYMSSWTEIMFDESKVPLLANMNNYDAEYIYKGITYAWMALSVTINGKTFIRRADSPSLSKLEKITDYGIERSGDTITLSLPTEVIDDWDTVNLDELTPIDNILNILEKQISYSETQGKTVVKGLELTSAKSRSLNQVLERQARYENDAMKNYKLYYGVIDDEFTPAPFLATGLNFVAIVFGKLWDKFQEVEFDDVLVFSLSMGLVILVMRGVIIRNQTDTRKGSAPKKVSSPPTKTK